MQHSHFLRLPLPPHITNYPHLPWLVTDFSSQAQLLNSVLDHGSAETSAKLILKPDQIVGWVFKMPHFSQLCTFPPPLLLNAWRCAIITAARTEFTLAQRLIQSIIDNSVYTNSSQRCFYASVLLASEGFILFSGETSAPPSAFSWKWLILRNPFLVI